MQAFDSMYRDVKQEDALRVVSRLSGLPGRPASRSRRARAPLTV
jgi:hypothetical protein